ncbi:MAG: hypothetical protein HYZ29_10515 [Myxococcales bacterium]|nr:hypothetical protein [Myxococcales bacterium]
MLQRAFPRADHAVVYDWTADGQLGACGHTLDARGVGWGAFGSVAPRIASHRQYALEGADPFADRSVTTEELFRGRREALERLRAEIWAPLGSHAQLRLALYDRGRICALVALLTGAGEGDFTRREAVRLDALATDLRDALTAVRALGAVPSSSTALGQTLDAFEQPAFMLTAAGAIVHANRPARGGYKRAPEWLSAAPRERARLAAQASVTRVEHEGRSLYLVIPRGEAPLALPPSLRRVAELAAAGRSDKQIALALDMPLHTVRTYVRRIYERLGVQSRVGLAKAWSKPT